MEANKEKKTVEQNTKYHKKSDREGGYGEGGGFRMGNTGIPVADSFRYLVKLIQYCKV